MDIFVCGVCRTQFNDLTKFMDHKKSLPNSFTCSKCSNFYHLEEELLEHEKTHSLENENSPEKMSEVSEDNTTTSIQILYTNENPDSNVIENLNRENEEIQMEPETTIFMCKLCNNFCLSEEDICKHLQEIHGENIDKICVNFEEFVSKLIPVNTMEIEEETNIVMQMMQNGDDKDKIEVVIASKDESLKKKRGRPRKDASKELEMSKKRFEEKENDKKEENCVIDASGRVQCLKCKKKFSKQRQFNGHRCWGKNGDFIDLSKNDLDEFSNDSEIQDVGESDDDVTDDYKANLEPVKRKNKQKEKLDDVTESTEQNQNSEPNCVPVFTNEKDRNDFEEQVKDVDLSCVDDLFTTHVVEQEINQLAINNSDSVALQMFSCTICKKVFKTLSHMRLHCLIHTTLKPFKCTVCGYASNAKGNLYTHMRKHTGNLFSCSICDFKSCNRSHVTEHEATHSSTRHICRICNNDYNTTKSLTNHVRKYHKNSKEGREYLTTFMLKTNTTATILFQCHICNRKFKKRLDRDRHLLIHQSQRHEMFKCELCCFSTSRKTNLETHFQKHRIVFTCCQCLNRMTSSVRLQEHLQSHVEISIEQNNDGNSFSNLFEESIKLSWYLPEPTSTSVNTFNYANIPLELLDENENQNGGGDEENVNNVNDIVKTLKYKQLSMEIYNKIRDSFGNEECRVCGRLFHSKSDCEVHVKSHASEKPFKCVKCEYSSTSKENLKRHTQTIHEKRKFLCDKCGFTAFSKTSMWHHQQKHREVAKECPQCKKMLGNSRKLETHLICAHPLLTRKEVHEIVGLGLNKRQQGKMGKRSYKCPYCNRIFHRSNTDLKKHIWIHEGIKPFKCPVCPHACRSRNNLNVHLLTHSNSKPHSCQQCGKAYKSKTALNWHLRSHSLSNNFSCSYCDYTANQKSHLKRHLETHEIDKKYKCHYCKYSANTLGYIKVHHTKKHKDRCFKLEQLQQQQQPTTNNNKAFNCISCEYLFGNMSDLKRHLKVRHQMNLVDLKDLSAVDATVSQPEAVLNDEVDDYQLVQVETDEGTILTPIASSALQVLEMTPVDMDENTASAVNIIQQLIQQNSFNTDSKQLIAVNPDESTIITSV